MSLWDALRMNMMISYQELVRTFLSELDDFDDSDDDFTFAPRKKTRIEPKKEKVKVRCVYAGGMF
jgi:hypothetical protein